MNQQQKHQMAYAQFQILLVFSSCLPLLQKARGLRTTEKTSGWSLVRLLQREALVGN